MTARRASDQRPITPSRQPPTPGPAALHDTARNLVVIKLLLGLVGVLLVDVSLDGPLSHFDGRVAKWMNRVDLSHPLVVRAAQWATFLGSTAMLGAVVAAAALYLWLIRRKWWQAVFVIATAVAGLISNNLVKLAVGRDRPTVAHAVAAASGKSFPSGHAMNSAVVYGALVVVAMRGLGSPRRRRALVAGVAALVSVVALSRVVLIVHYVTDVIAGASLGAVTAIASGQALRAVLTARANRPSQINVSTGR